MTTTFQEIREVSHVIGDQMQPGLHMFAQAKAAVKFKLSQFLGRSWFTGVSCDSEFFAFQILFFSVLGW